jgi:hypothetical protein
MMRRNWSLLLLVSLAATGSAPLAGERLLCPMPMRSVASAGSDVAGCDACAMDSPAAAGSLEASSCCRVAPASEAETVPATLTAQRRGAPSSDGDGAAMEMPAISRGALAQHAPTLDSPPPIPAFSPPTLSTHTTHLRN